MQELLNKSTIIYLCVRNKRTSEMSENILSEIFGDYVLLILLRIRI
jgi:hypothetical protein